MQMLDSHRNAKDPKTAARVAWAVENVLLCVNGELPQPPYQYQSFHPDITQVWMQICDLGHDYRAGDIKAVFSRGGERLTRLIAAAGQSKGGAFLWAFQGARKELGCSLRYTEARQHHVRSARLQLELYTEVRHIIVKAGGPKDFL